MISDKRNVLQSIIESSGGVHLSAYLKNREDPSDFRSQLIKVLRTASENIRSAMPHDERIRFLKPLRCMLDDKSILFNMSGNLGIFRNANSFRILRIPIDVQESCMVANSFHVKPLLKWIQSDRDFLLLGIEKGAVQLYQGSQYSLRHVDTLSINTEKSSFPQNLAFWTKKPLDKKIVAEICHWLENKLDTLTKVNKPKLFIAGSRSLSTAIKLDLAYRNISKHPAWPSFRTRKLNFFCTDIRKTLRQDAEKYLERSFLEFVYANRLELTETNIFRIARAAIEGRVKKLMIAGEINLFGKLNRATGNLVLHKNDLDHEDDCVLDDIAQTVLINGGKVFVASREQAPGRHPILAITEPLDPEMSTQRMIPSRTKRQSFLPLALAGE